MKKDLRKMLKDGMTIVDCDGNSFIITNNGLNYIDKSEGKTMYYIYEDFNENLEDVAYNDECLDIELIYDNKGSLIWEKWKERYKNNLKSI